MEYTKLFKELNKNDAHIAGGKGASLGEMLNAGIPVPDGFVVLSSTFDTFLHKANLIQEIDAVLDTVNHKEIQSIDLASEKIQDLIKHSKMPDDIAFEIESQFTKLDSEFVAIRSSATAEDGADHAWAGQLESYLNIEKSDVLEKVQHCWASLFTPRAIFYRFEKGLHTTKISVAVVIQKMVNSEKSGIAFSVHPVTEDRNQLIIEAGLGLGEAIVSGAVTPDSYVVEKEPRRIIDINVANQTKALYRKTGGGNVWVDLEPSLSGAQVLNEKQILEFSEIVMTIENHYGFPCDIEWAYENSKFYITQSRPITTLKPIEYSVKESSFFKDKSEYFSWGRWVGPVLEHETWINWCNTDEAKEFELIHETPGAITVDGNFFLQKDGSYQKMKNLISSEFKTGNFVISHKILDLSKKLSEECISMANSLPNEITFDDFIKAFALMCRIRFPWTECFPIGDAGEEFVHEYTTLHNLKIEDATGLIPNLPNSLTNDQKELTKFKTQIEQEKLSFDISEIEKTNLKLADEIKTYQKKTEYLGTHHFWGDERNIERLMDAIKNSSPKLDTEIVVNESQKEFDIIAEATKWRLECAQSSSYLAYAFRPFLTTLANKYGLEYEDLIFLLSSEIKDLIENNIDVLSIIRERQKAYGLSKINNELHVAVGSELYNWEKHFGLLEIHEQVQEFKGSIGNKGFVTGEVVIVFKPSDQAKVLPGMILVAPETTPDYIPAMGKAIAFVTDQGGITSHAAIVAREMGKPCITGTKIATKILKDGDIVEVDANNGTVKIIKKALPRWEKVLQRNFPPLALTTSGYFEFTGFNVGPMNWIREREILIKYKTVQMYMIQDPSCFYISNINDLLDKEHPDFEEAIDKINKDVYNGVRINPGTSLLDLKNLNDLHIYMYGVMLIGFDVAIDIKAKIDSIILNNESDFQSYLATPTEETGVQREKKAINDTKNNPTKENLEKLVSDFGYIHQDYLGQPWEIHDYKEVLKDDIILNSGMDESYNISNFSPYEQYLIRVFKKMIYMYEEGRNAMVRVCWAMKETIKKLGYDQEALLYMTETEVRLFAENKGPYINDELLAKRKEAFAMYFESGKYHEFTGNEEVFKFIQDQNIEYIWEEKTESENTLKGSIAYKGKATGKVRLVFTQEDANNVKEGEILISPMTQVEFLSGIRKCAAIVTDEGGIICHAAIVSREFGKPCILATGKATKVFKNGDIVEVDADNGIVRLIEANTNNSNGINFDNHNWNLGITRNMSFWHSYISCNSYYSKTKDFGVDAHFQTLAITEQGTRSHIFTFSENLSLFTDAIVNTVKTKKNIINLKDKYFKFADELFNSLEECLKSLNHKNLEIFLKKYEQFAPGLNITAFFGRRGLELLTEKLILKGYSEQELPEIISVITYPEEHTPLFNSQLDLFKIGNEIQKNKIKDEKIILKLENWLKDYAYIPVNFCDEPWTIIDAEKQLKSILQKNCKDELKKLVTDHESKIKKSKKLIKNIKNEEITILAFALSEATFLNEYRKSIFSKVSLGYRPIFKELAQICDSKEWRDCFYLTPDEMLNIIDGQKISLLEIKKERDVVGIYINNNGELKFIPKNDLNSFHSYLLELQGKGDKKIIQTEKTIKGFSANKGKVKGIARIILDSNDFEKLNRGDILVATMTSVDFVPIMERAGAFVTNEGGITSHASIVAREMNKPCVIGTKNATQLIKDGDMVEVDADNGVINILERYEKKTKEAYLVFTRDHNQWMNEMVDYVFVHELPHVFGAGLSTQITFFTGRTSEWYRFTDEMLNIKQAILNKDINDSLFSIQTQKHFLKEVSEIRDMLSSDKLDGKNNKEFINEIKERFIKMYPPYLIALFVPGPWKEDFIKIHGLEGETIVERLFHSREKSEGLLKDITNFMREWLVPKLIEKGYPPTTVTLLSVTEVEKFLKEDILPSLETINERAKGFIHMNNQIIPVQDLASFFREQDIVVRSENIDEGSSILKGTPAYKSAPVKGEVKIILNSFETGSFQKGMILVTPMTAPEYLPIMEKAVAVITDEGGITCHAAIVSRELKIPCIIGTKNATKILKDGNMIEVDANTGIIRILS